MVFFNYLLGIRVKTEFIYSFFKKYGVDQSSLI